VFDEYNCARAGSVRGHDEGRRFKLKMDQALALERDILRALCNSRYLPAQRGELLDELVSHTWRSGEHRVVYEALKRSANGEPDSLRAELPAATTRLGFPDIDWGEYFGRAGALKFSDLKNRIRELIAASSKPQSQP